MQYIQKRDGSLMGPYSDGQVRDWVLDRRPYSPLPAISKTVQSQPKRDSVKRNENLDQSSENLEIEYNPQPPKPFMPCNDLEIVLDFNFKNDGPSFFLYMIWTLIPVSIVSMIVGYMMAG